MDERLKKALDFSNYRQTLAVQRKILKEKLQARLTFGYSGGVFYIDKTLITFVQMCIDQGRTSSVPVVDSNENPILIEDMVTFRDQIFDRYFTATNEYMDEYNKIKVSRTVEKLIDL
jgi:hypothetical protein